MFGLTRVTPNFFLHHGFSHLGANQQTANHTCDEKERTCKEPRQTAVQIALRRFRRSVMMMVVVMMVVVMVLIARL